MTVRAEPSLGEGVGLRGRQHTPVCPLPLRVSMDPGPGLLRLPWPWWDPGQISLLLGSLSDVPKLRTRRLH